MTNKVLTNKILAMILGCGLLVTGAQGQDLHLPSDINAMMKKSLFYYEQIENPKIGEGKILDILPDDLYFLKEENGAPLLFQYRIGEDEKVFQAYQKALNYGIAGKYNKERKILEKLLESMPKNAIFMTAIGRSYFAERNYAESQAWAKTAIRANHIHYPAYMLLAQTLMMANKTQEAMKVITKAHLLNRNSQSIIQLLKEIYAANGRVYDDNWAFIPEYAIEKTEDNKIIIQYNGEPWRAYAACRAAWKYEPYYEEKMKITSDDLEVLREHECLLNMAVAFEGWEDLKRKKKFYMGNAISVAVKKNLIQELINYEVFYVENPKAALNLTVNEINDLTKYILEVRALKMPQKKEIIEDQSKLIDKH